MNATYRIKFPTRNTSHLATITHTVAIACLAITFPLAAQDLEFGFAVGMGSTGVDAGTSVTADASGNVYTTGTFQGTVDFDPGAGTSNLVSTGLNDVFVQKLDSDGDFVWAIRMGGSGDDLGVSIATDDSGNVYIVGNFDDVVDFDPGPGTANLTSEGGSDIFVQKLDSDGDFVWANAMGGTSDDTAGALTTDDSGQVFTTGRFNGTVDFDPGTGTTNLTGIFDIFVQKLDTDGDFEWAKGITGPASLNFGFGIAVDSSGNVHTTGQFSGTVDFDPGPATANLTSESGLGASTDIFVQKLDSDGNFVWANAMGGDGDDAGIGIAVDTPGNVFTTGRFSESGDFNPGAATHTLTSSGGNDIFVEKLDSDGNFLWADATGGTSDEGGVAIDVDSFGDVYVTGEFQGTVDFDPGLGSENLTSAGINDIFITKLKSDGDFAWAGAMGGTILDVGAGIAVDSALNVFTTGLFQGTADFDPGTGTANLTATAGFGSDIFVSKLTQPLQVVSIVRADADPTEELFVDFTVMFSKSVTGVDTTDFVIDADGVTDASITEVVGASTTRGADADDTYTVTVDSGDGDGTLSIDVVDDDTIIDSDGRPLGGTGAGNGNFTGGEEYTFGMGLDEDSNTGKYCLIANITYGTPLYNELDSIRAFRDEFLLTNPVGSAVAEFYYRVSPVAIGMSGPNIGFLAMLTMGILLSGCVAFRRRIVGKKLP
jgi:hypothetical protein